MTYMVQTRNNKILSILDIGTGSGCIPITLKKNLPQAKISGIDISEKALEVAKLNAIKNNVDVEFLKLDILSELALSLIPYPLSLIVSNPPYVLNSEAKQMEPRVLEHEPHIALFVDDNDALIFYRKIAELAKNYLTETGQLFFEINQY